MESNFDVNLEALDPATRREIFDDYQQRACALAARVEGERAAIGQANRNGRKAVEGLGPVRDGLHIFDFFAQPVLQGADRNDPDFWKWFETHHEEGDYARVTSAGSKSHFAFSNKRSSKSFTWPKKV
jgi:hypothetical protein